EKEKTLLILKDSIISKYANKINDERFNDYHQKIASKIDIQIQNTFEDYALLELKEKSDTIDELLKCFESILKLYESQAEIPLKLKRINEAYTRIVWNPFTMSDME